MIASSRQSANMAIVPTIRKGLRHAGAADACLAGPARVNLYQHSTGAFCLIREHLDKGTPSGIVNGLCQHPGGEPLDVQIFNCNQAVPVNQIARNLMLEVPALISDMNVRSLEKNYGLTPAIAPLVFPACHFSLGAAQRRFAVSVMPAGSESRRHRTGRQNWSIRHRFRQFRYYLAAVRASRSTLKQTNQCAASRLIVTVLIVPSTGRCSLILICPAPWMRSFPLSSRRHPSP